VSKHANVEVSGQTVKACLIKHRSNKAAPYTLDKREMFGNKSPSNKRFTGWIPCLMLFDRV